MVRYQHGVTDWHGKSLFDQQATAPRTRQGQILEKFRTYHEENPDVFRHFERFAFEAIEAGRERYSARGIIHRVRWHVDVEVAGDEDEATGFKINDHYSPYYGRLFALKHPEHASLFERRECVSKDAPPKHDDQDRARPLDEGSATVDAFLREML